MITDIVTLGPVFLGQLVIVSPGPLVHSMVFYYPLKSITEVVHPKASSKYLIEFSVTVNKPSSLE